MFELLFAAAMLGAGPNSSIVNTQGVRGGEVVTADTTRARRRPAPAGHIVVGLTHSEETFTSTRSPWREDLIVVRLDASGIAAAQALGDSKPQPRSTVIAFEGGRAERFGQEQGFGGFDFYKSITRNTYANLRLRFAPHAIVIPEFDVLIDITGVTTSAWEASAGYRLMRFKKSSVGVFSAAGAYYHGAWYFRSRVSLIPVAGSLGTAVAVSARRYFQARDDLIEVVVTRGREVVTGSSDVVIDVRDSVSGLARAEYYFARAIGMQVGASYTRDAGLSRWGLVLGIKTRI